MELDLSGKIFDWNNGTKAILKSINISYLPQIINLSRNKFDNNSFKEVILLLDKFPESCKNIQEINLSWCDLNDTMLETLSLWVKNKNIELLDISLNDLQKKEVFAHITDIIFHIKKINLTDSMITNENLIELANKINASSLESLTISYNLFNNITYLFETLYTNTKLKELYLSRTDINNDNMSVLIQLINRNKSIHTLHIGNNSFDLNNLYTLTSIIKKTQNIKNLSVRNSGYNIKKSEENEHIISLLDCGLEILDISLNYNYIDNYKSFLVHLKKNKEIKSLNLSYCDPNKRELINLLSYNNNIINLIDNSQSYFHDLHLYGNVNVKDTFIYYNNLYNKNLHFTKDIKQLQCAVIISLYSFICNDQLKELTHSSVLLYIYEKKLQLYHSIIALL